MKCPRCGYEWEPKVLNPKECPRCKARLDYAPGVVGAPRIGKKGGEKVMVSKLTWATAMILIVAVVGVGAWAILGGTPVAPPTSPAWSFVYGENTQANNSGIIAIYIAKSTTDTNTDPETWGTENYFAMITSSSGSAQIPYGQSFYIVVSARGAKPYIANLTPENIKVELELGGDITLSPENKTGTQFNWYTVEGSDNIRVSAVWGTYTLSAGQSFNYTAKVWLWY